MNESLVKLILNKFPFFGDLVTFSFSLKRHVFHEYYKNSMIFNYKDIFRHKFAVHKVFTVQLYRK